MAAHHLAGHRPGDIGRQAAVLRLAYRQGFQRRLAEISSAAPGSICVKTADSALPLMDL